jgi:hypothetical protein
MGSFSAPFLVSVLFLSVTNPEIAHWNFLLDNGGKIFYITEINVNLFQYRDRPILRGSFPERAAEKQVL